VDEMLDKSSFVFLVDTAEDETADEKIHVRQYFVCETGLFRGKLGFFKAFQGALRLTF
jgi:predicted nucleotide-binding protein